MLPQTHLPAIIKPTIKLYQLCQALQMTAKLVDYSSCNAWQPSFALSIINMQEVIEQCNVLPESIITRKI
jgi:hypothetical protein